MSMTPRQYRKQYS